MPSMTTIVRRNLHKQLAAERRAFFEDVAEGEPLLLKYNISNGGFRGNVDEAT